MGCEENIKLIERFYDEVYKNNRIDSFDKYCSQDAVIRDPSIPFKNPTLEQFKQLEAEYQRAFPDKKSVVHDVVASDNKVVIVWTCKGTNLGSLMGLPPTNKQMDISGISCYTIDNGKITKITQSWDTLGLLQQLGGFEAEEAINMERF